MCVVTRKIDKRVNKITINIVILMNHHYTGSGRVAGSGCACAVVSRVQRNEFNQNKSYIDWQLLPKVGTVGVFICQSSAWSVA